MAKPARHVQRGVAVLAATTTVDKNTKKNRNRTRCHRGSTAFRCDVWHGTTTPANTPPGPTITAGGCGGHANKHPCEPPKQIMQYSSYRAGFVHVRTSGEQRPDDSLVTVLTGDHQRRRSGRLRRPTTNQSQAHAMLSNNAHGRKHSYTAIYTHATCTGAHIHSCTHTHTHTHTHSSPLSLG